MSLFQKKTFIGAGGLKLTWKIECDALSYEDWEAIAAICAPQLPRFSKAIGIPRGGKSLADRMDCFATAGKHPVLVVDDVWTTGRSMREFVKLHSIRNWCGFVAFDRSAGCLPNGVYSFMKVSVLL